MFHLAPCTVCEGDVYAPGGLLMGREAVVLGDVYTDGTVELGQGAAIHGQVRPSQAAAAREDPLQTPSPAPESLQTAELRLEDTGQIASPGAAATPRSETELELSALKSTVELLFDLAEDHGTEPREGTVWGLKADALSDLMDGILVLVADVFLEELPDKPWPADVVLDLVYGRAIGSHLPLRVEERSGKRARLRVGRPQARKAGTSTGWPKRALSVLAQVGQAARPGLTVEPLGDPEENPSAFELAVEL